ncbi:MAG: hypothetical protein ABJD97_09620 [Betaproteobacteria bacterium]
MPTPRVAVIAVHGVADQLPGQTARTLVELMVSSAPEGTCYTSCATEDLTLRVPPLQPQPTLQHRALRRTGATPKGEDRPLMKALAQSARSDFQRDSWSAPHTMKEALTVAPAAVDPLAPAHPHRAARPAAAAPPDDDRGIAVTNYLLTKHIDNGARPGTYDTTRLSLLRHDVGPDALTCSDDDTATQVDVFEMYWADLSRLSGTMPRIVSELFTMVFRLSKLGRETVDEMWGQLARARDPQAPGARLHARAWTVLGSLQIALDWLFVNGLALLFTQLALLAIVLACLGFASGVDESWLHRGVAIVLGAFAVLRFLYRRGDGRLLQALIPIAVLGLAVTALTTTPSLLQWLTAFTLLAAVTGLNEFMLRIADDRFPLVHVVGRWMWAASAVLMLGSAFHETAQLGTAHWRDVWVHSTLFTTEAVLLAIKWWWIVAGGLLLVGLGAGLLAQREGGYASRASVATGRLGIAVSLGMFLVVTMSIWAMLNGVLDASADRVGYRPCIFALRAEAPVLDSPSAPVYAPNACLFSSASARDAAALPVPSARTVLEDRYVRSTSTFSLLAALLVGLLMYLLVMFTPSVLAELKLIADCRRNAHQEAVDRRHPTHARRTLRGRTEHARALGRWLTAGYRRLDMVVLGVTLVGVTLSLGIAALFAATIFHFDWLLERVGFIEEAVSAQSQTLFAPLPTLAFSAAGVGAALSLLGGQLSRHIPSLRGPLDVALDVDNHFREFPRTDIPRAHIFSRYAALLDHVASKGYDRIVIVAHSQGTVISSELLRFLSSRQHRAPTADDTPMIGARVLPPISLLTLGCPLRQLYGARFPGLYSWVLAKNDRVFGPRATDIGVQRWMNAFCSGDYVGRWLWSSATKHATLDHPMINHVGHDPFGRIDAYTGFNPHPPAEAHLHEAREVEVCLGLGAHTHYFERDQTTVAWMVDYLIRARPLGLAEGPTSIEGTVLTVDATDGQAPAVVPVDGAAVADGQAEPATATEVASGVVTPP